MKQIPLTQGKFAIVDDEDYEELSKYRWHFSHRYAVRAIHEPKNNKSKITLAMHNAIMNPPAGMECDHIDGNGLNNQRSNLRICTHAENLRNQVIKNEYGATGVNLHSCKRFFMARIHVNGKTIYLGNHRTLEAAKKARLEGEIKYFGEFRRKPVENID